MSDKVPPKLQIETQRVNTLSPSKNPRLPRSKLHNYATLQWLTKRHNNTASSKYLFLPEELRKHQEIHQIFHDFDESGEGKLSVKEALDMMHKIGIYMDQTDLEELYAIVDLDQDGQLNLTEFKNCALSEEADDRFKEAMRKLRKKEEEKTIKELKKIEIAQLDEIEEMTSKLAQKDTDGRKPFFPTSFGALLNYITYKQKKEDLKKKIEDSTIHLTERFSQLRELVSTQIQTDSYVKKDQKYQNSYRGESDSMQNVNSPGRRLKSSSSIALQLVQPIHEHENSSPSEREDVFDNENQNRHFYATQQMESTTFRIAAKDRALRKELDTIVTRAEQDAQEDFKYNALTKNKSTHFKMQMASPFITTSAQATRPQSMFVQNYPMSKPQTQKEMARTQAKLNRLPRLSSDIQNHNANLLNEETKMRVIDHLKKSRIGFNTHQPSEMEKQVHKTITTNPNPATFLSWNAFTNETKNTERLRRDVENFQDTAVRKYNFGDEFPMDFIKKDNLGKKIRPDFNTLLNEGYSSSRLGSYPDLSYRKQSHVSLQNGHVPERFFQRVEETMNTEHSQERRGHGLEEIKPSKMPNNYTTYSENAKLSTKNSRNGKNKRLSLFLNSASKRSPRQQIFSHLNLISSQAGIPPVSLEKKVPSVLLSTEFDTIHSLSNRGQNETNSLEMLPDSIKKKYVNVSSFRDIKDTSDNKTASKINTSVSPKSSKDKSKFAVVPLKQVQIEFPYISKPIYN